MKPLAIAILLCFLTLAESSAEKPANPVLKVGVVLGLTGDAAAHGDAIRKGVELATNELRSSGWTVELAFEDDQTNPAKTVSALQSLIARDFHFFIGPTWSFQVKAASTLIERGDVVAVMPAGSSLINGGAYTSVFNLSPRRTRQRKIVADWVRLHELNSTLVLTPNGDWGELHHEVFVDAIRDAGVKGLISERFDEGIDINSLRALLLRSKRHGVDGLIMTGSPSDVANLVRARNELKQDFKILSTDHVRDAIKLGLLSAKDDVRNVYSVHLSVSEKFQSIYRERFGASAQLHSDRGYDALMIFSRALEKTNGTPTAVREYFSKTLDYEGMSSRVRFDKNGDVIDGAFALTEVR